MNTNRASSIDCSYVHALHCSYVDACMTYDASMHQGNMVRQGERASLPVAVNGWHNSLVGHAQAGVMPEIVGYGPHVCVCCVHMCVCCVHMCVCVCVFANARTRVSIRACAGACIVG